MNLVYNIKPIRDEKNLKQIEFTSHIGVNKLAYSKIEKELRSLIVDELQKMITLFNMTTDRLSITIINCIKRIIEDKTFQEQMYRIQQLDEDNKQTTFKLIEKMLINKKFKDSFKRR